MTGRQTDRQTDRQRYSTGSFHHALEALGRCRPRRGVSPRRLACTGRPRGLLGRRRSRWCRRLRGPASGALCGAFALIQSDNELASPAGLALGAVATLALGYQYAKRFDETPRNPLEWPGPRLMPTLGVLFSLFAFLANVEALPRVLSPLAI